MAAGGEVCVAFSKQGRQEDFSPHTQALAPSDGVKEEREKRGQEETWGERMKSEPGGHRRGWRGRERDEASTLTAGRAF